MSFRWLRAAPLLLSCVLGACSSDSTEPVVDSKACADGKTRCGSACVDLNKDPRYCGACGRSCDVGQVCSRGSCQLACQNGLTDCSGGCTNLKTDLGSCGACETRCDSGMVCSAGTCAASCQAGLTLCAGLCIDTQGDLDNCGACGKPCAQGQLCAKGKCSRSCEQGLVDCNGQCRDLTADEANCGVCATACAAGERCVAGKCVVECGTGLTDCSGSCKDLAHDPTHCGDCAMVCPAAPNATPVCTDSTCGFVCKANFANCGSGSSQDGCNTDLSTDPFNCGACGHFCLGKSCVASQCEVETLVTGLTDTALTSNGQFLFYRGYESIMQLPLDGGSVPVVFASGVPIAFQMAIHGNFLIWTEYNTGVWTAPILGGTPMPLATGSGWLSEAMTVGQGYVYWTNDSDSSIRRVSLAGGQPELIATNQSAVSAIDTDATHVYWTNQAGGPERSPRFLQRLTTNISGPGIHRSRRVLAAHEKAASLGSTPDSTCDF
ncbi:MAG: hypothetical protein HY898_31735, partial [Deltaproteobacteria bacterium]|nr:hypothetical protein [Deltaproteobacteria bacterium]